MPERLIDAKAADWVDRGQEPEPEMHRVLEFHVGRDARIGPAKLRGHVIAIRGMVEGGSSEVQLAGYLALLEKEIGLAGIAPPMRRTVAIALWHIAKCAVVRDRARRLLASGIRPGPIPEPRRSAT